MKKIILCLLLILPGCNSITNNTQTPSSIILGSQNASQTWIYLCGLTKHFNPQQMNECLTLDAIGKDLNIKILAIIPHDRCPDYNHCLCWPHNNKSELLDTYKKITNAISTESINGYIGFSNGGFFLTQLAQYIPINKPIIVIGAAGQINNRQGPHNTIHLLIGKQDQWHYEHAINLYEQSKKTNLTINLIEYNNGHEIPMDTLKNVLQSFL